MAGISLTTKMMKISMITVAAMEEEETLAEVEETIAILRYLEGSVPASSGRVPISALTGTDRCYCE
jgi:hypothetical protein